MEDFRFKVLSTVAETGSFTKAASMLGVSQPAVSQNIRELEKEFSIVIFKRVSGKVSITPQGRILLDYSLRVQKAYLDISTVFNAGKTIGSRNVRLYASPVVKNSILTALLDSFASIYPEIHIEIKDNMDDAEVCIIDSRKKEKEAQLSFDLHFHPVSNPVSRILSILAERIISGF